MASSWGEAPSGHSPTADPVPAGTRHNNAANSVTVIYDLFFN